ncbi:hypothetical protein DNX55_20285 [Escherichia coli]|nr:hypothetical protein [Escherichia coli]
MASAIAVWLRFVPYQAQPQHVPLKPFNGLFHTGFRAGEAETAGFIFCPGNGHHAGPFDEAFCGVCPVKGIEERPVNALEPQPVGGRQAQIMCVKPDQTAANVTVLPEPLLCVFCFYDPDKGVSGQ